MTNTNSPAEPTPSNPVAGTTAAAATGKPARKAPRRATAAAGAPLATTSPAPALLVIDANGMIVPPPAMSAPESPDRAAPVDPDAPVSLDVPETFDAGTASSPDAAAIEVVQSADTDVDTEAGTDAAVAVEEKIAAEDPDKEDPDKAGPDKAVPAEVAAPEPTAVEPSDGISTSTKAIDDSARDSELPDQEVPDSEASVAETAPSDATLAAPDSIANAQAPADTAVTAGTDNDTLAATDTATGTSTGTAPISRRERRLAEQAENGEAPIAAFSATKETGLGNSRTEDEDGNADAVDDRQILADSVRGATARKAKPRAKRNRFVASIRGLFFLLVISAVVVATGTVLSGPEVDANQDSPTQLQRHAAWEATMTLQTNALSLADAASTPVVRKELSTTAKHLGLQAAALSDGLPSDGPTAITTAPAVSTIAELIKDLAANADSLLVNAQTAEGSLGRVFASVGTSQLLQAEHLGSVTGATVPTSAFLPAKVSFPVPTGPQCTSTLEPRPGVTVDSALSAAALAEQKAVYAYQVATTRFAEPQFSTSKALLARHQKKLQVLNEELRLRCLPQAAPVAGFELDSTFTKLPKQALSTLELELGAIYADLSALSTEDSTGVSPSADPTAAASPAAAAASATADTAEQPFNGSNLREIAVVWLLDSIQTHTFWGGTVDALPGIADEAATASAPA